LAGQIVLGMGRVAVTLYHPETVISGNQSNLRR
jgi:hypothetical protein